MRYHTNPLLAYSVEMPLKLSISTRVGYHGAKNHQFDIWGTSVLILKC